MPYTLAGKDTSSQVVIAEEELTAAAASIDFTNISADYRHLRILISARGDAAATAVTLSLRFNGDSTASYDHQRLLANATAVSAETGLGTTSAQVGLITAANANAGHSAILAVDIPHYAGTDWEKIAHGTCDYMIDDTSATFATNQFAGRWRSTAAINRITLLPGSGNFAAGTLVTVYAQGKA